MRIISTLISATVAIALFGSVLMASETQKAHWGYTGHGSPDKWASLSPDNEMCGMGKNQSPINVASSLDADLEIISPVYTRSSTDILNNGHTIQVNMEPGSSLSIDGMAFDLKQFHFHAPSENHIEGKSFPLEAHFVHLDRDGNIAVLALMFEDGEKNEQLEKIWNHMPKIANEKLSIKLKDAAGSLLPKNKDYYRFNGSLTTPPCTEGVRWIVLKTPVTISKDQVAKFLTIMEHPNNRPIQTINSRVIVE
ncbi:MAG: hypothetical protein DRG30_03535 [Epsilonproteobacteria bacterium]|nr:MAG: hypothetical protein DRG30_03535 [Campylobacterota bacterium]